MGCDIHLTAEFRDGRGWRAASEIRYDDHNYSLFAILADVRR